MNLKIKNKNGFTLTELLVVLGIITLMLGISTAAYKSFQFKTDIDSAQNSVVQSLRRAQILAQGVNGDSNWGVYIQGGSVTVFKGNDYFGRDISADELTEISNRINLGATYEVVFSKFSGEPGWTGDVVLSSGDLSHSVSVNEKGVVSY